MEKERTFSLDEISLLSILWDLLRNLPLFFLAAAAAWFAVTGAGKLLYVPEYTATATLAVNARGSTSAYGSLTLTNQMASVFGEVFTSDVLRERIAQDMGVESFEGQISASVIEETNLITLQVTGPDPRETYLVIRSALDNYDTVSDYLFSNAVLRIVQEPSVPYSPSNILNIHRIRRLSMLGASACVAAAVILLSVLRFTVKTREGAVRNLDGKILGYIPYERKVTSVKELFRKKKKSILTGSPVVSLAFSESIRKAATRISHHMKHRNQKVLLVTSVGENEGKSSVAANLALAMAEKGKKVLLVDADLKKPAQYRIFDRPEGAKAWFSDYLEGNANVGEVLTYNKKRRFYAVYQNNGVKSFGSLLDSGRMKAFLGACRKNMDYIILDTPPMGLSSDAELLMRQTDTVLLVVRQDWTDIRIINDMADVIRSGSADFAGILLNAFRKDIFEHASGNSYGRYYGRQERGGIREG